MRAAKNPPPPPPYNPPLYNPPQSDPVTPYKAYQPDGPVQVNPIEGGTREPPKTFWGQVAAWGVIAFFVLGVISKNSDDSNSEELTIQNEPVAQHDPISPPKTTSSEPLVDRSPETQIAVPEVGVSEPTPDVNPEEAIASPAGPPEAGAVELESLTPPETPIPASSQLAPVTLQLIDRPVPRFPPLAKQARIQGVVRLSVGVAPDGSVHEVHVLNGHVLLRPASIEAVRKWRYASFQRLESELVWTEANINFTLD